VLIEGLKSQDKVEDDFAGQPEFLKNNDYIFTKKILLSSLKGQEYSQVLGDKINEIKNLGNSEYQEINNSKFLRSISKKKTERDKRL
jgi:hypothetical protein